MQSLTKKHLRLWFNCFIMSIVFLGIVFCGSVVSAVLSSPSPSPTPFPTPTQTPTPTPTPSPTISFSNISDPSIRIQRGHVVVSQNPDDPLSPVYVNENIQGIPVRVDFPDYQTYLDSFQILGDPLVINLNLMDDVMTVATRTLGSHDIVLQNMQGSFLDAIGNAPYSMCGSFVAFGHFFLPDDRFLVLWFSSPLFANLFDGEKPEKQSTEESVVTVRNCPSYPDPALFPQFLDEEKQECDSSTCTVMDESFAFQDRYCKGHIVESDYSKRKGRYKPPLGNPVRLHWLYCLCDGSDIGVPYGNSNSNFLVNDVLTLMK